MEVLRRIGLVSLMLTLMMIMIGVSALTGTAQGGGGQYAADQYEPEGAPAAPDWSDVLYCAPQWLREWG